MNPVVCFGEIMLRLTPPGVLRLPQVLPGTLKAAFAGAEANVAVAVAQLGGQARFVTALPHNPVGDGAVAVLRASGVDVRHVVRTELGRCGTYFIETGASQRGGLVLYDRDGSSFALNRFDDYPWSAALAGAGWFHTTGISAGVSRIAAEATARSVQLARAAGLTISIDLNFRRKLWRWEPGAAPEQLYRRTLAEIIPGIDVLIGNARDIAAVIGEDFAESASAEAHVALATRIAQQFSHISWIAITLRENDSASSNRWGAMLFRTKDAAAYFAPGGSAYRPYGIDTIVDRVGTGDAFAGALIFALQTAELADPAKAIAFATAAGCLAHSIKGDFFYCTRAEVESLMNGSGAGYLSR